MTDLDALLAAEVDRLMPGWAVDVDGGRIQLGPMRCPRCGALVVLIDLPPPRRSWWREVTAEGLAERLGPHGQGSATALPCHESWRCQAGREAALAALPDLDELSAAPPA